MSPGEEVLIHQPAGLEVYPPGYGPLFERAAGLFAADERVRAMWLHGAIARGAADAGSDLDISVAIRDADYQDFVDGWKTWLAAIAPTLTARPTATGEGNFYALTTTCERFDVICEPVSKLASTPLSRRIVVFDKDDLDRLIPPPNDAPPNTTAMTYLIEETLRQAANFPTVIVRQDWLLGVIAVQQVQLFLYQLFAESNKPMPPTGPKQWSAKLTARQRQILEALPVAAPAEQSVRHAREAAFAVFFAEAPAIAKSSGIDWPHELEAAVRAFLIDAGLPLPNSGGDKSGGA
jgi:hypothetical protein